MATLAQASILSPSSLCELPALYDFNEPMAASSDTQLTKAVTHPDVTHAVALAVAAAQPDVTQPIQSPSTQMFLLPTRPPGMSAMLKAGENPALKAAKAASLVAAASINSPPKSPQNSVDFSVDEELPEDPGAR